MTGTFPSLGVAQHSDPHVISGGESSADLYLPWVEDEFSKLLKGGAGAFPPSILDFWRHMSEALPAKSRLKPLPLLMHLRRLHGAKATGLKANPSWFLWHPAALIEEGVFQSKRAEIRDKEILQKRVMLFLGEEPSAIGFRTLVADILKEEVEDCSESLKVALVSNCQNMSERQADLLLRALSSTEMKKGESPLRFWRRVHTQYELERKPDILTMEYQVRLAPEMGVAQKYLVGAWSLFREAFQQSVKEHPNAAYDIRVNTLSLLGLARDPSLFNAMLNDFERDPTKNSKQTAAIRTRLARPINSHTGKLAMTWPQFLSLARKVEKGIQEEQRKHPATKMTRAEFRERMIKAAGVNENTLHYWLREWKHDGKPMGDWIAIRDRYPAISMHPKQITRKRCEILLENFAKLDLWIDDRNKRNAWAEDEDPIPFILGRIEDILPPNLKHLRKAMSAVVGEGYDIEPFIFYLKKWNIPKERYSV
ncbi:MAG: hypothetical protein Q7T03_00345 [Deltaproteobacteria bacterium]|nr:hypothetical protein [Deltaproteobacteria bacterium]